MKLEKIKNNFEFRRIYSRGASFVSPYFVLYVLGGRQETVKMGITVSKKIGNAVERNRSRRVIREAFRSVAKDIDESYDFVFVARSKTKYLKSTYIEKVMRDMMQTNNIITSEEGIE